MYTFIHNRNKGLVKFFWEFMIILSLKNILCTMHSNIINILNIRLKTIDENSSFWAVTKDPNILSQFLRLEK